MVRLTKKTRGFIKAMTAKEKKDLCESARRLFYVGAITEARYQAIRRNCK